MDALCAAGEAVFGARPAVSAAPYGCDMSAWVRIGGVPMQTVVDVIDTDALPPGGYVATFRVRGPGGWDRKAVHLRIADAPGDPPTR